MLKRVLPSFFFVFLIIAGLAFWIFHRNRSWTEVGQRALILIHPATSEVATPLSLAIWHPADQTVLILPLPAELRFTSSANGELYHLNTLPRLAEVEQWPDTRWWREVSLEFGLVFDGTLRVNSSVDGLTLETLEADSRRAVWSSGVSSLGLWDRYTWWQAMNQADSRRSQKLAFDPNWLTEEKTLNHAHYDRFARLTLQDSQVRQSLFAVQVVNASGMAGQAGRQARMLEIMGFGVRSVETAEAAVAAAGGDSKQPESLKSNLQLQSNIQSTPDNAPQAWAQDRLRQLYTDWPVEMVENLTQKERVEARIQIGE